MRKFMNKRDWTLEELEKLEEMPLMELLCNASSIHSRHHKIGEIQVCSLLSIKTGGCPEDCKYCAQSSRYKTAVEPQPMMKLEEVLEWAKRAQKLGVTRVCLGAAWRQLRDGNSMERVLEMIREISALGVEVCCTLGMLTADQAERLKEAGLYAYNHNLDTSERFYPSITTTRSYQERLETLDIVHHAGLSVCCGGILGMGEEKSDRIALLHTLSKLADHPESVPVNMLTRNPGTPLESREALPFWEYLRFVAMARIVFPNSMVRLSCGRKEMSYEQQCLCFFAGANSIHIGEKLLTVANTPVASDKEMFKLFGLTRRPAYVEEGASCQQSK